MTNHKSALVLIDLQKESNFGLDDMNDVLENAKKMIPAFREADIPIIYTRQINREDTVGLSKGEPLNEDGTPYFYNAASDQIEIFDEIKPADDDVVIDKYRWSAFFDTSLDLMLKSLDVDHLYIGGVVTDGCLMTSVFDAYFRDYQINLIHDLCTASNEGAHQAAMLTMTNWVYNLNIFSTDELIKKLNGEEYNYFKADQVDQMQFTADTMEAKFKEITNP
ncbi:cysteine hydrolase family protein [Alkalibacillus almallahensis]|uniref:cysteine hydrolase family protein n=1 Tax=Alkalibacillus almallahensis TaxID=1379154 RepID=UPI00141FD2AF|nr:isochorismatase family cysteine hydrolase [Alkalibacillus almallahensis]NIK11373.1 nicotinamidase-related amidase [Alkalibacillus almallahensis]